jgi:predicted outer membrane protein
MALKNSHNDDVKKFAQQVINDNHRIASQLEFSAMGEGSLQPEMQDRQLSDTNKAKKQMKKLTGQPFDQIYLVQMDGWIRNDQQTGHSAYAMLDLPRVSTVGKQVWDLANERAKQIPSLTQEEHFKIE